MNDISTRHIVKFSSVKTFSASTYFRQHHKTKASQNRQQVKKFQVLNTKAFVESNAIKLLVSTLFHSHSLQVNLLPFTETLTKEGNDERGKLLLTQHWNVWDKFDYGKKVRFREKLSLRVILLRCVHIQYLHFAMWSVFEFLKLNLKFHGAFFCARVE